MRCEAVTYPYLLIGEVNSGIMALILVVFILRFITKLCFIKANLFLLKFSYDMAANICSCSGTLKSLTRNGGKINWKGQHWSHDSSSLFCDSLGNYASLKGNLYPYPYPYPYLPAFVVHCTGMATTPWFIVWYWLIESLL